MTFFPIGGSCMHCLLFLQILVMAVYVSNTVENNTPMKWRQPGSDKKRRIERIDGNEPETLFGALTGPILHTEIPNDLDASCMTNSKHGTGRRIKRSQLFDLHHSRSSTWSSSDDHETTTPGANDVIENTTNSGYEVYKYPYSTSNVSSEYKYPSATSEVSDEYIKYTSATSEVSDEYKYPYSTFEVSDEYKYPSGISEVSDEYKYPSGTSEVPDEYKYSSSPSDMYEEYPYLTSDVSGEYNYTTSNEQSTFVTSEMPYERENPMPYEYENDKCSVNDDCTDNPEWFCRCDKLCEEYQDCCKNFNFANKVKSKYSCVGLTNRDMNFWGVFAISVCPETYTNSSVVDGCRNGTLREAGPPVVDVDDGSAVFRNKHCAACNGITNTKPMAIHFYKLTVDILELRDVIRLNGTELNEYLFAKNSVYNILVPTKTQARPCFAGLVTNSDERCKQYVNPIVVPEDKKIYRNSFCMSPGTTKIEYCLHTIYYLYNREHRFDEASSLKLSILFSFKTEDTGTTDHCEIWSRENEDQCNHLPIYTNAPFRIMYYMAVPINSSKKEMIQAGFLTVLMKNVNNYTNILEGIIFEVNHDDTIMKITTGGIIRKRVFGHEIQRIEKSLEQQQISIFDDRDKSHIFYSFNQHINLTSNFTTILDTKSIGITGFEHYLERYDIIVREKDQREFCNRVEIAVDCTTNETWYVKVPKCSENNLQKNHSGYILTIITYIACSISTVALFVMIIVNRRRKLHREIPFSNLENLSLALVLSNVLSMTGVGTVDYKKQKWTCFVISLVLHYLWLAVFSFASLSVLFIVKTLFQIRARHIKLHENIPRKRRLITIAGLLAPLVFVGPALVVDRYGPSYYSPGYGKSSFCFPTQFPGNLIFFTGPVLIAIINNTLFLMYIIIKIKSSRLSRANVQKTITFAEAKIFLRILSLTCSLWITGIVAVYLKVEWLEYVFTLLCGSQGLLIAMANMSTKRIRCRTCGFLDIPDGNTSLELYNY